MALQNLISSFNVFVLNHIIYSSNANSKGPSCLTNSVSSLEMFALRTVRMFKLLVWDALTVIESKHTNQNVHSYRIISNIAYYVDSLKSNHCVYFKWQIVNLLTNEREITRAKCLVPVSQIEVKKASLWTWLHLRNSCSDFQIYNF